MARNAILAARSRGRFPDGAWTSRRSAGIGVSRAPISDNRILACACGIQTYTSLPQAPPCAPDPPRSNTRLQIGTPERPRCPAGPAPWRDCRAPGARALRSARNASKLPRSPDCARRPFCSEILRSYSEIEKEPAGRSAHRLRRTACRPSASPFEAAPKCSEVTPKAYESSLPVRPRPPSRRRACPRRRW